MFQMNIKDHIFKEKRPASGFARHLFQILIYEMDHPLNSKIKYNLG